MRNLSKKERSMMIVQIYCLLTFKLKAGCFHPTPDLKVFNYNPSIIQNSHLCLKAKDHSDPLLVFLLLFLTNSNSSITLFTFF